MYLPMAKMTHLDLHSIKACT